MLTPNIKALGFEHHNQYSFPNIVNLCVFRGDCPCGCVHCPVGLTSPDERPGKFGRFSIRFELFKKIVGEMADWPHATLRIHGIGEPILWKELSRALAFSATQSVRTWLFTSLLSNTRSVLERIAADADIIEVSVNSINREDYLRTKGVDGFSTVEQNISLLRRLVTVHGYATRLIASRVQSRDARKDSEFVTYWRESGLVDDAFIRGFHDYNRMLEDPFQRPLLKNVRCLVHWNRFNIDSGGSAVVCFNELFKHRRPEPGLILGDVNTESIQEIWHSGRLEKIRNAQLKGDYELIDFADNLPCIHCSSCQPANGGQPSSEHQVTAFQREFNRC